jgi:hypothetical protein
MSKWLFALIQFFPLSTFATYAFWSGIPSNERWLEAFQLGALLAIVQFIVLLVQVKPMNRLVLAGNIYLLLGGSAVYFQQWWYLEIYNYLRESAIIFLMILIGFVTTFTSSSGFIAVTGSERKLSYYLLSATILALPFAFYFEGNRTYSAVLPIISLALFHRYLVYVATQRKDKISTYDFSK